MSATILPFTGNQKTPNQIKSEPAFFCVPAEIPQFYANQSVWIVDHETGRRAMGTVFRQSQEWVQVRLKGHNPVAVHVPALEVIAPEAA